MPKQSLNDEKIRSVYEILLSPHKQLLKDPVKRNVIKVGEGVFMLPSALTV